MSEHVRDFWYFQLRLFTVETPERSDPSKKKQIAVVNDHFRPKISLNFENRGSKSYRDECQSKICGSRFGRTALRNAANVRK